ncbi:M23 family metallopeptidase [Agromyces salentinus]|uniref:M23 family metallopeptidase n=1 Tax=Agromyces salentinus TaxID=269421 RepID=UPI0012F87A17|nr:M23 family metallopeptidase [Agromyces salentinus]
MKVTSAASGASRDITSMLGARSAIDRATGAVRTAEKALADAKTTREGARSLAREADAAAETARAEADAAARTFFAASNGSGDTSTSMDAVFGSGKDLLAGLAGMARVEQIAGDTEELEQIAAARDDEADAAEEAADAAWAAADEVPVDEREDELSDAERALTAAKTNLSGLQAKAAASSIAVIDTLPADSGQLSDQGWSQPVAGRLTDGYGPRPDKPIAGVNEFHRGTDVAAACKTPVFAATGGVVIEARANGSYGNWVLLDHGAGVSTGYAHLIDGGILVEPGQSVSAGQLIGMVGSTGASTGCHLHFEVRLGGMAVDARPFMAARGIAVG